MQLRRIEVRDFRKLRHAVVENLADGLNVLVGDNEAGKSTLLAALRAVLFERHRVSGLVAEAMLPHGQALRPEVSITFDLKGARWQLRKAFHQRPEAELIDPAGRRTTGDAVEERLAELFGFTPPGRGATKPEEHHGIYGLLWVEQASAHRPLNASASHGPLAAALEGEVGQVMGGERGRLLLAEAEKRRNEFWDKRGSKPRGKYRELIESIETLDRLRSDLDTRLRRHDDQVAALAKTSEILARHARDDRLNTAVRELEAARAAQEKTRQLADTLEAVAASHRTALEQREYATERKTRRDEAVAKLEADRLRATIAADENATAKAALVQLEEVARSTSRRWAELRAAREKADLQLAALEQNLARQAAVQTLQRAAARLNEAESVATKARDALAASGALRVTKKDVADLDRIAADLSGARIKRDAASVQITFEPVADNGVTLDGASHPAERPLRLSRDAVLDLGGFGRLQIRPGGGVEALARAVEAAERHLATKLRELGQASREAAADALARKLELDGEAAGHKRVLATLAPEGLEALRLETQTLSAAAGPDVDGPATPVTDADRLAAQRLKQEHQRAEKEAEAELVRLNGERERASTAAAVRNEQAMAAARDQEAGIRALASARSQASDEVLAARLAETHKAAALAAEAETLARAALEATDPDTIALELKRALAAEAAIRTDIETLTRQKRDLEVELRALGTEGFGEQIAEAEGRLALLRRQEAARALEARAGLLLHTTLLQAQSDTKDRWLGPVRDRVRPYLKLLQPDSDILLNESTFSIEHLVRGGVSEPFESLSVGAREQIAVITRLALAEILRGSGQPSAVILDDALVNTDESRLRRMHLVLQKAAETLQVLVLTCREPDFVRLGAPIHRL